MGLVRIMDSCLGPFLSRQHQCPGFPLTLARLPVSGFSLSLLPALSPPCWASPCNSASPGPWQEKKKLHSTFSGSLTCTMSPSPLATSARRFSFAVIQQTPGGVHWHVDKGCSVHKGSSCVDGENEVDGARDAFPSPGGGCCCLPRGESFEY